MSTRGRRNQGGGESLFNDRSNGAGFNLFEDLKANGTKTTDAAAIDSSTLGVYCGGTVCRVPVG